MFRKKLAWQMGGGLVVIVLLASLLTGAVFLQMFKEYSFKSREISMLEKARTISQMLSEVFENSGKVRGVGNFVRFLEQFAEADIWATDAQGNLRTIVVTGAGSGTIHQLDSGPLPEGAGVVISSALLGTESTAEGFDELLDEAVLIVGVPIYNTNQDITGAVILRSPVIGVNSAMHAATRILLISLIGAFAATLVLSLIFAWFFTRPLLTMNKVALAMAGGNYQVNTGIHRQDEIGQLSQSLDTLATALNTTVEQLFQEKGKLEEIIGSISEGLLAFDASQKAISINPAFASFFFNHQEHSETQLAALLASLQLDEAIEVASSGSAVVPLQREHQGKIYKFTVNPIFSQSGAAQGCVMLVQDISASEQLEQLRRDFVANVSHEFRTPLTIIRGSLEALIDQTVTSPAEVERYHRRMEKECRGLERLISDLLDLSKLESGNIALLKEQINLCELFAEVNASMRPLALASEIQLTMQCDSTLPPLHGDYYRLRQLLVIFLDNAIKYSSPGGSVAALAEVSGRCLHIIIRDGGRGIAPEEVPHIWDRFYQIEKSRHNQGTGLGLAIAKHIIDLHHGSIEVKSQPGLGTTFTLHFKLDDLDEENQPVSPLRDI
jgi:two-component system sensor histidine kinase ResE